MVNVRKYNEFEEDGKQEIFGMMEMFVQKGWESTFP